MNNQSMSSLKTPDYVPHGLGAAFFPEHHPRRMWKKYVEMIPCRDLIVGKMHKGNIKMDPFEVLVLTRRKFI